MGLTMPRAGDSFKADVMCGAVSLSLHINLVGYRCRDAVNSRPASAAMLAAGRGRNIAALVPAEVGTLRQQRPTCHFRVREYSMLSVSAWRLASMMFSLTPTVPHSFLPSLDWMRTRVLAAVPVLDSRMRTL